VVTYHSDIVRQKTLLRLYRPVMRAFLNSVDRIVATSPDYLAGSTELNRFKNKATVIPIGINRQHYPAVSPERKSYWQNLLPERFFLFVGVLRYYKGLPTLLNAAAETGYPVVIVGDGPEGPELKRLADSLKLGNCFFLGAVNDEDKVALLDLAYAFAFPSHLRSEAFGVSLVEASMFHTPMITCDIGTGTSYVNRDGVTGYVVPPGNPQAFAAAMNTLWQNPAGRNAMGEAAFQRYSALFTADRMAAGYLALYESLLNGEPPSHTAG
jgi:rhamnosyl/mannosyltransferase